MGTEAFWIPVALAAAGTGVDYYAGQKAASERDRVLAGGIKRQRQRQSEADARVNQELDARAASNPDDERKASMEQFMAQLKRARGPAGGTGDVPTASNRYEADSAGAKAGIQNFGMRRADTASRIAAPIRQRTGESISGGRTGADVGLIGRKARGDDYVTQLKASSITEDPWLKALGIALRAAGMAYGVGGAAGATGGASAGSAGGLGAGGGAVPATTANPAFSGALLA